MTLGEWTGIVLCAALIIGAICDISTGYSSKNK